MELRFQKLNKKNMTVLNMYQVLCLPLISQINTDFIRAIKGICENLFNLWLILLLWY